MGADENAAVVRRGYEAFNAADINALNEMFDESAVWHAPGRSSLAGDYEGRRGDLLLPRPVRAGDRRDLPGELGHLLADDDDYVVGVQRSRAERQGKNLDVANCIVFRLEDGRVVEIWEHFDDLYVWDELVVTPSDADTAPCPQSRPGCGSREILVRRCRGTLAGPWPRTSMASRPH